MKRLLIHLYLIMSSFLLTWAQSDDRPYILDVGDFNTLQIIDDLTVTHRCNPDSAGLAVLTGHPVSIKSVFFTNKGNKLKIELNVDDGYTIASTPSITVYSNFLNYAENCGDSTLSIISPAPGASFKVKVIGNGKIIATGIHATQTEGSLNTGKGTLVLEGVTKAAKFKNIGTGRIEASDLEAQTATITILGTGAVDCYATEELVVKGMGTGSIKVKGNPVIKKRVVGPINIKQID